MAINQQYPSLLLEKAVGELSKLPGVGRKTALRLALHLLRQNESEVETFSSSILKMKQEINIAAVVIMFQIQNYVLFVLMLVVIQALLRCRKHSRCDGNREYSAV